MAGDTAFEGNLTALELIAGEWTSARPISQRVANLSGLTVPGGDGGAFAARANAEVFLLADGPNRTVFDDNEVDTPAGAAGRTGSCSTPLSVPPWTWSLT